MKQRGRKPKPWRERLDARQGSPEIALTHEGFAARTGWKSDRIRLSSRTRDPVAFEIRKRLLMQLLREGRERLAFALLSKRVKWGQLEVAAKEGAVALQRLEENTFAVTLSYAIDGWLKQYEAKGRASRRVQAKALHEFLKATLDRDPLITDITGPRIKSWIDGLTVRNSWTSRRGDKLAPVTRNLHRSAVSLLCDWAIEHGYLTVNPVRSVRRARVPKGAMPVLQAGQVALYLEGVLAADLDPLGRRSTLLWCAVATGADVGELLSLTPSQVAWGVGGSLTKIQLQRTKTETKLRSVPIGDEDLVARLRSIIAAAGVKANKPIFAGVTSKQLWGTHRWGRKAAEAGDDITIKALRHVAAQMWRRAGVDLQTICDWLGHASIEQTVIYTAFGPDTPSEEDWAIRAAALHKGARVERQAIRVIPALRVVS